MRKEVSNYKGQQPQQESRNKYKDRVLANSFGVIYQSHSLPSLFYSFVIYLLIFFE